MFGLGLGYPPPSSPGPQGLQLRPPFGLLVYVAISDFVPTLGAKTAVLILPFCPHMGPPRRWGPCCHFAHMAGLRNQF